MEQFILREVNINYGKREEIKTFNGPEDVVEFLRKIAPNNSQEHVIAIYLDGSHAPIGYSVVTTGSANCAPVHPREVFQRAVMLGACAIILAHNHPSGSIRKSREDDQVTARIGEAGVILGIKLLDHVIFTDSEHFSYNESGDLHKLIKK